MRAALLIAGSVLAGCATAEGSSSVWRSPQRIPVTLEALNADPFAYDDKWVQVEGWARVPEEDCCARLTTKPDSLEPSIAFNPDMQVRAISRRYDQKSVRVTGKVDLTCVRAWNWSQAENQKNPDRFIVINGYCHSVISPSLSYADFEIIGQTP